MSIVVGFGPDARARGALELGAMLARSRADQLVVCCVVAHRWETPGAGRVDSDYVRHLDALAREALGEAREVVGEELDAAYVVRTGRSVPATLAAEATDRGARLLALGSSTQGAWGHVALGSVTDRLVHSAAVPLALAPRGFRAHPGARVLRVTVALDGTASSIGVLETASRVALDIGAALRVVTFAVRGRTMYPPEAGLHAEDTIMAEWRDRAAAMQQAAVASLELQDDVARPERSWVAEGRDWADAIERVGWQEGDVLVLGSSPEGAIRRVFLGSTATRILRNSPVPVVLLPAVGTG